MSAITDLKTFQGTLHDFVTVARDWVDAVKKTHHFAPDAISQMFISIKMVKWFQAKDAYDNPTWYTKAKHICHDTLLPDGSYDYNEEIKEIVRFLPPSKQPLIVRITLETPIPNRLNETFSMDIVQLQNKTYEELTKELSKF
jgi:hypothetical protein